MSQFSSVGKRLVSALEMNGRRKACQHLRGLSDQQLKNAGLSRDLLQVGVSAWPWQAVISETDESEKWVQVPAAGKVANDVQYEQDDLQAV